MELNPNTPGPTLAIGDLVVEYDTDDGCIRAVDGVSLDIGPGEAVGLVGESGCGKSAAALSILRLIPTPPGRIAAGRILFQGRDILAMPSAELRALRGANISMIFQEPATALSPLCRVGDLLVEALQLHRPVSRCDARTEARDWLRRVGIPDPDHRMRDYPHSLSGGMRQRVMIAMALMLNPEMLIADEPTTALDVTVQAQVLDLIRSMRQGTSSLLLITHDMGVVRAMCDRVAVMYAGRIVESGTMAEVFESPLHPYTIALLQSLPSLNGPSAMAHPIRGQVPSPLAWPTGCRFHPRCPRAIDRCRVECPVLAEITTGHMAACIRAGEGG